MKYFHLIWAALFRRKTRTILTLVSIIAAFLLFGLLDAVRVSFEQAGQSANGAERLQTGARLSFIETLPFSLGAQIERVPGVNAVAYANWFGGAYQDPHNQIFTFAVSPNYIDMYPEFVLDAAQRKAWDADLNGVVDPTDYFLIDQASNAGLTNAGWINGDFDYNGVVDSTDYFLIDNAFHQQSPAAGEPLAGNTPVVLAATPLAAAFSTTPISGQSADLFDSAGSSIL